MNAREIARKKIKINSNSEKQIQYSFASAIQINDSSNIWMIIYWSHIKRRWRLIFIGNQSVLFKIRHFFIIEQQRKRKEWIRRKVNFDNEKSEAENSAFVRHSTPVDEGLIGSGSDEDESFEMPEKPNPMLVAGKKLIPPIASKFCSRRYTGMPLQEMDDFYRYKKVFFSVRSTIANLPLK